MSAFGGKAGGAMSVTDPIATCDIMNCCGEAQHFGRLSLFRSWGGPTQGLIEDGIRLSGLDASELDYLGPLLDLCSNEFPEFGGCHRH